MTDHPRPGTPTVMPFTRYKDASAAIEWLCAAFGFHKQIAFPGPVEIVRAIENTDYGAREYTARDLEGHLWSFGSYLPGSAE